MTNVADEAGPLRDKYVRALVIAKAVAERIGLSIPDPGPEGYDESAVEQVVDDAVAAVRERLEADSENDEAAKLALLAFRLSESRQEIRSESLERRWSGLGHVQVALGRLRAIRSSTEMMERAPKVLCEECGFSMAALSRIAEAAGSCR